MVGGGGWEPGEWTDDTAMAIAIAEVAATGADLRDAAAQDAIVAALARLVAQRQGRRHPDPLGAAARPRATATSPRERARPKRPRCMSGPGAPPATAR